MTEINFDYLNRNSHDYFDKLAEQYDELWTARLYDNLIINALPKHANLVLDIGCGTGSLTYEIGKHAKSVQGFDMSEKAIKIAKKKHIKDNVAFEILRIEDIPEEKREYCCDAIVAAKSLHHCECLDELIPKLTALIRPGGRFIILELRENIKSIGSRLRGILINFCYIIKISLNGLLAGKFSIAYRGLKMEKKLFSLEEWIDHMDKEPKFHFKKLVTCMKATGMEVYKSSQNCRFMFIVGEKKHGNY